MEHFDKDRQTQILRKRVHGLQTKNNRKSQAIWESLPKKPLNCISSTLINILLNFLFYVINSVNK